MSSHRWYVAAVFVVSLFCDMRDGRRLSAAEPQWIWQNKDAATKAEAGACYFRKSFSAEQPDTGRIEITADNRFELFVNGRRVGAGDNFHVRYAFDISRLLVPGRNVIGVAAANDGADPAGLAAKVLISNRGGKQFEAHTDATWKVNVKPQGTWAAVESDDSLWGNAVVLGPYGKTTPWGAPGELMAETKSLLPNKPRVRELGEFELRDGDRVVLLGGAFIERLQYGSVFETALTASLPQRHITFRNLGWSGDNVWGDARAVFGTREDGMKRLVRDVIDCDPTVIVICYGENEAFAGDEGLAEFKVGLEQLTEILEGTGARLVFVGPRKHENLGPPLPNSDRYNTSLRKYSDAVSAMAKQRGHSFIDLFDALPARPDRRFFLTYNGIHLSAEGQELLARSFAQRLAHTGPGWAISIDAKTGQYDAVGALLDNTAITSSEVRFNTKVGQLAFAVPTTDANGNVSLRTPTSLRVTNLRDGNYELRINGTPAHRDSATQWALGVRHLQPPSDTDRIVQIRKLYDDKNELYFHRYRPQNETYLFLFRKHEQGNNAVEIPQFDPLVAEKEKAIASLKVPQVDKFELIRVE